MLYPFTFEPILKEVIWGGEDIRPYKGLPPSPQKIGESWELSDVKGHVSIVANGHLKGKSLDDVIHQYGAEILGNKVFSQFGTTFPLLIKFIDARNDLSIQVHPNDELARKRHNSFGKTEMWYVIKTTPEASLYSGFSQQIDAEKYVQLIEANKITDVLQKYQVKTGDVFFLPAGRIHAICAGCFIAEIQQTSDITYRIYDYNRKDANGQTRELHTDLAKDAIDYTVLQNYRTEYKPHKNECVELARCKYFTTNLLDLDRAFIKDTSQLDSFVVCICMEGHAGIEDDKGNTLDIRQGDTILFPAETKSIKITPRNEVKFLESYID